MKAAHVLAAGLSPAVAPGLRPGGIFGGYSLIAEVGRGAMGVVFTAQQQGSKRVVALKFAHSSLAGSAEAMQRFRTEAEAVAALDHPGILPIYEVGERDGLAYYTMRFAEAGSLAEQIETFREPRRAAALVERVAEAVQHAHERGILHRDLKPGNILLATLAEPLVSDFGLARWMQRESDLTASLSVLGTPDYLAPEMLRGAHIGSTTAADVFSLGAILYHLLGGRAPFAAASVAEVLRKVEECAPPPLPAIPRDLAAVCLKCLEREPAARYASAGALAADLRAWLAGQPVAARHIGPAGQLVRWVRRKPVFASLVMALLASLTALLVSIFVARGHALASEHRRAEIAERLVREQRRTALLARAQLCLSSPRAGRRIESLAMLREASALGPSVEIRNVVIAALATPDAVEAKPPPGLAFLAPSPVPDFDFSPPARVLQRAFHPATRRLALAGKDKQIYLVDPDRRAIVCRLRGQEGECLALSFSPDGHWLAAAFDDQTVRLWDVRGGQSLLLVPLVQSTQLRWSGDAAWLEFAPGRALRIHAPAVVHSFIAEAEDARTEGLCTIDLSADGRWLVTGAEAGTRIWDTRTRRDVALFPKDRAEWSAARFSPDSHRLWIGGWNSGLRATALPADERAIAPPVPMAKLAGALFEQTFDGAWLIAVSNVGGGFQCVAAASPHRTAWLLHPHPLNLALTPAADLAATSSFDSPGVRVWDFRSAKMLRELPVKRAAQLAFTSDGGILATGKERTVVLWNPATGEPGASFTTTGHIRALAFSPDGRLLAIETRAGLILHRATAPPRLSTRSAASPPSPIAAPLPLLSAATAANSRCRPRPVARSSGSSKPSPPSSPRTAKRGSDRSTRAELFVRTMKARASTKRHCRN